MIFLECLQKKPEPDVTRLFKILNQLFDFCFPCIAAEGGGSHHIQQYAEQVCTVQGDLSIVSVLQAPLEVPGVLNSAKEE